MGCTVEQLMNKCKQALKEEWQYVYGAKGAVLSKAQIDALRNQYGSNCVWWSDSNKAGHKCCEMYEHSRKLPCAIFAADFLPKEHKFNQCTLCVCLINLCTSDKGSSHKSGYKEFPRALRTQNGGNHE